MPKIFEVGGCVRDRLLGHETDDIDFTFVLDDLSGTTDEGFASMEAHLRSEGFKIFLSTPSMFTIKAKFPKGHKREGLVADFVMSRKEIGYKEDSRHPELALGTLEDDLRRRDFTVNALAQDLDGNIIDLFDGREDLKKKILRTPLDPEVTFLDDPLRVVRALRFSITKGFEIDADAWDAMFNDGIVEKLGKTVSIERIQVELKKMFMHDTPGSLKLLADVAAECDNGNALVDAMFSKGLWLFPTMRDKK